MCDERFICQIITIAIVGMVMPTWPTRAEKSDRQDKTIIMRIRIMINRCMAMPLLFLYYDYISRS